jgi:hypothetical protein
VGALQELRPPATLPQGLLRPSGQAWAAERSPEGPVVLVQASGSDWSVAIGSYPTEAKAWQWLNDLSAHTLRIATYVPKNLRVFKGSRGFYYVSYSDRTTRDEATRLYNSLRVNDPELASQIHTSGPLGSVAPSHVLIYARVEIITTTSPPPPCRRGIDSARLPTR